MPIRLSNPLRYSLRTFFVAVTVICLLLGSELSRVQERRQIQEWVFANGGYVLDDLWIELTIDGSRHMQLARKAKVDTIIQQCTVSWFRKMLGDESVCRISMPNEYTLADLARVQRNFPGAEIVGAVKASDRDER